MRPKLLHVYRNTPLGRETLLQSAWFCQQSGCELEVYIPRHPQFLLFFEHNLATVSLDETYLRDGESAEQRVHEITAELKLEPRLVTPTGFTAPTLPNLGSDYAYMACPRSMSEQTSRIRIGHLGPRVRSIVKASPFPVLLPTPIFKPWKSVVACYGGSENSSRALLHARQLAADTGVQLSIFTQAEGRSRQSYEQLLEGLGLLEAVRSGEIHWLFKDSGSLESNLFDISREALVVIGAYGRGAVREALFGSMLETIQAELPHNLLVIGPQVVQLGR